MGPHRIRAAGLGVSLALGCFTPGDSEAPQDTDPTTSSPTSSGDPSGSDDPSGMPSESGDDDPSGDPTDDGSPTSAPDTSAGDTSADDATTGTSECNDVDAPCPDEQYCVDNRYCDNPPAGMVAVPGGPFWMGCNDEVDTECADDEYPYHEVTLAAFAISRTEVTVADYAACVTDGACSSPHTTNPFGDPCDDGADDLPATCVDWFQANDYCEWTGGSLPTEAQWEKAARGTDGRLYPWGDDPPTCAHTNMSGCEGGSIAVGSKPAGASPYGALDMSGNVFEWVSDWYDAAYYVDSPAEDPAGPDSGSRRITRSAAFNYIEGAQRNSWRGVDFEVPTPEDGNSNVGFRCAFTP